jgi:hypothetical protein
LVTKLIANFLQTNPGVTAELGYTFAGIFGSKVIVNRQCNLAHQGKARSRFASGTGDAVACKAAFATSLTWVSDLELAINQADTDARYFRTETFGVQANSFPEQTAGRTTEQA